MTTKKKLLTLIGKNRFARSASLITSCLTRGSRYTKRFFTNVNPIKFVVQKTFRRVGNADYPKQSKLCILFIPHFFKAFLQDIF